MRIERIDENMIRVTVSINDLEERDIDIDSLHYNSPEAQELFWDMMEQAEFEFGFNISDSQIIIEPIPDDDDEFIITITKLDEDGDFESIHKYIKNKFRKSDLKIRRKSGVSPAVFIYKFDDFEDLCNLCSIIKRIFLGNSSVYEYHGVYYLVIRRDNLLITDTICLELQLEEFGERVYQKESFSGFLNEHANLIISDGAVEKLSNYFKH